jgi:hypothetical protein
LSRGENLEDFERIALHLLFLEFERIKDFSLISKLGMRWLAIKLLIKIFREDGLLTFSGKKSIARLQKIQGVFLSPRAYLGQEKISPGNLIKRNNRLLNTRRPPPQAYIGVGYRDKGNARKRYLDGSPSWQSVAVSEKMRQEVRKTRVVESRRSTGSTYIVLEKIDR